MPSPRWPHACFVKLLDLIAQKPCPKYGDIAEIIAAMPEARAAVFFPSRAAVLGKAWRWKKRAKMEPTLLDASVNKSSKLDAE
jgi:hypothetical protein